MRSSSAFRQHPDNRAEFAAMLILAFAFGYAATRWGLSAGVGI